MLEKDKVYKVRIKTRARISQDFFHYLWPVCKPPEEELIIDSDGLSITKYPNAIFDGVWNGKFWDCTRVGYGKLRKDCPNVPASVDTYGAGSIFVFQSDGVDVLDEQEQCPHCGCIISR